MARKHDMSLNSGSVVGGPSQFPPTFSQATPAQSIVKTFHEKVM